MENPTPPVTEEDKLQQLLAKASSTSSRVEVRLRALQSLVFKLENGLVGQPLLSSQPFYLKKILQYLVTIASYISDLKKDKLKTEEDFIQSFLRVINYFAKVSTLKTIAPEEFSKILSKLYYATTIKEISLVLKKKIEEVSFALLS